MQTKEFQIPVPWGHIAVKTWGEETNMPVLAIHGAWDNLAAYDALIPLLPPSFYYIGIDLPSHGQSSHYPPYMFVSAIDNILAVKLVINYFKRKKYVIMGHSWGGHTSLLFAGLYPECCAKLILLDCLHFLPLSVPFFKQFFRRRIEGLITTAANTHNERRSYTFQEATNKIKYNRIDNKNLSENVAPAITARNVVKNKDKYEFNTDYRLKFYFNFFADSNDFCEILEKCPLACPLLLIHSSRVPCSPYVYIRPKNVLKNYFLHKVEGGHDAHGNNPEIVGPIIAKFLLKEVCKI